MKKTLVLLLVLFSVAIIFAGCAGNDTKTADEIDVDLTVLSSTMVYAEVNNIMTNPDDYMGKTIKVQGYYNASYYDVTDNYYHYVIIQDAVDCCAQGIEFILTGGDFKYPDDFPEILDFIEITGVFDNYDELDKTYYYLNVDLS